MLVVTSWARVVSGEETGRTIAIKHLTKIRSAGQNVVARIVSVRAEVVASAQSGVCPGHDLHQPIAPLGETARKSPPLSMRITRPNPVLGNIESLRGLGDESREWAGSEVDVVGVPEPGSAGGGELWTAVAEPMVMAARQIAICSHRRRACLFGRLSDREKASGTNECLEPAARAVAVRSLVGTRDGFGWSTVEEAEIDLRSNRMIVPQSSVASVQRGVARPTIEAAGRGGRNTVRRASRGTSGS
jgi:hypothetical protein